MLARWHTSWLLGAALLAACCSCAPTTFVNSFPPTLEEVNRIRDDNTLSASEKRDRLVALGLDPLTINAVLQAMPRGNQFGGSPRSAWDKVSLGELDQMTPDEVQLYGDVVSAASEFLDLDLTDAEAQGCVDLFTEQDIQTRDELSSYLANPDNPIPSTIAREILVDLFVDTDPRDVISGLP